MQSYSEIECAFICKKFSIDEYIKVCKLISKEAFFLDTNSPGYTFINNDFQYPDWKSLDNALEDLQVNNYDSFCINVYSKKSSSSWEVIIEADKSFNCISIKLGEEFLINTQENRINAESLNHFIKLMEKTALFLKIDFWKVAQAGFNYDILKPHTFIKYSDTHYPKDKIDELISWYNNTYLPRWNLPHPQTDKPLLSRPQIKKP